MRTTKKIKDKVRIPENVPSNLINRLLEESCMEMIQAAEMLARHTTNFEKDLLIRIEKQDIEIRELKKDISNLKSKNKN